MVALEKGEVDNLLMADVNPVYSLGAMEAISKAGFTAYIWVQPPNETSQACQLSLPRSPLSGGLGGCRTGKWFIQPAATLHTSPIQHQSFPGLPAELG